MTEPKQSTLHLPKKAGESTTRLFANGRYVAMGTPKHGGLATVHRAYDTQLERHVALKVFRGTGVSDEVIDESFRRETQALSDLRHSNIVEILGSGRDPETGEHYIAMEWVPADLDAIAKSKPFNDWGGYFRAIGRQLLEAIAFAHTHSVVHRDIKPSNVLVTNEKVVKVCDFGISKIRNFFQPGVTLAQFATPAFSPPEPDDGSFSYTRDVFAFAALSVHVLAPQEPKSLIEVHQVLDALAIDGRIKNLLRRCLSLDVPAERPQSAAVLLSELERLMPSAPSKSAPILFVLTNRVRSILQVDQGILEDSKALEFVEHDLMGAAGAMQPPAVQSSPSTAPQSEYSIRLIGSRYGYYAVPTEDGAKLKLTTALEYPPSMLEAERDKASPLSFGFARDGVPSAKSEENLRLLTQHLVEFEARQKEELAQKRATQIFDTWLNLLFAKTELERRRRRNLEYTNVTVAGGTYRFTLSHAEEAASLLEQDVRVEGARGREYCGVVIAVDADAVVTVPTERSSLEGDELPESGLIHVDTAKADAALDKQKAALDAVRFGRSVNPSLGSFIASPDQTPVVPAVDVEFIQENIDEDKQEAVKAAMAKPALLLVQGPPGTGKTTFITELVLQTLREAPEARILLSSQTHVALDNSIERISKVARGQVRIVRVGSDQDVRISESAKALLIDRQLPEMRRTALESGKRFIESWAKTNDIDISSVNMALALERCASLAEREEQVRSRISELRPLLSEERRAALDADTKSDIDQELQELMKESESIARDMRDAFADVRKHEADADTIKHLQSCTAGELRAWADDYAPPSGKAKNLRKLLQIHTDWGARFGRNKEFRAALVASSQVVAGTCLGVMAVPGRLHIEYDLCIIDEASIATPTEVLVPMSRARRVVLVGDSKQLSPFQDPDLRNQGLLEKYGLKPENQRDTLFNHLAEQLPEGFRKRLSKQHRMVPAIGNLVSECFYEGALQSERKEVANRLSAVLRKPVVWLSTAAVDRRRSRSVGTSHENRFEVQQVTALLGRIDFILSRATPKSVPISIAVLSGYRAQRDALRSAIELQRHAWSSFSEVFVNVVDAFQGREADIVVFSVTRSDDRGLGFLKEIERINVALSRGRDNLVIVGDHVFCEQAGGEVNPLREVLNYIRRNPDSCVLEQVTE